MTTRLGLDFDRYFKEIAEFDGKTTQANILRSLHQFNQNNQLRKVFMITIRYFKKWMYLVSRILLGEIPWSRHFVCVGQPGIDVWLITWQKLRSPDWVYFGLSGTPRFFGLKCMYWNHENFSIVSWDLRMSSPTKNSYQYWNIPPK